MSGFDPPGKPGSCESILQCPEPAGHFRKRIPKFVPGHFTRAFRLRYNFQNRSYRKFRKEHPIKGLQSKPNYDYRVREAVPIIDLIGGFGGSADSRPIRRLSDELDVCKACVLRFGPLLKMDKGERRPFIQPYTTLHGGTL